ncbi:hypothetical protein ACIBJC_00155 [Streptomyces sp. NPDC050509]|uniref:hypothetical protein n=1 Tax=Streptomyces sp. NPDC050509 TaxID=3365620 RepID=UPI0037B63EFF
MALNAHPGRHGETEGTPDDAVTPEEEPLPCGRELIDVWEAWDAGEPAADPHLAHCPHCTAALADLTSLDDAVRRARQEEADDGTPPAELTGRIMDIVRLELRPGRTLPLGAPEEDDWIVEAAAARAFRAAAETLPGVRAGSCRISPLEPRATGSGTGGPADRGPVQVRLEVAAGLGRPLHELAEAVRTRVADAARDAIGIEVARIDVLVVDLLDEDHHTGEDHHTDDEQEGGDR